LNGYQLLLTFWRQHPNGFQRRFQPVKEYELVVLFHPSLEVDMTGALAKVAQIIGDAGGKIVDEDDWGRRRLAYKIAGEEFAIYRVYTLELPADAPQKLSGVLNITDEVLRFLLTKIDAKAKAILDEEKRRRHADDDEERDDDRDSRGGRGRDDNNNDDSEEG
jgi:small subunit ribosomal protein S6